MRLKLDYCLLSDRGLVHERNEDRCGAFVPEDAALRDERGHLFVLADGVGGHAGGDAAAELAVHTMQQSYFQGAWTGAAAALRTAFTDANANILARARASGLPGMSATTVAAAVVGTHATVAHLGDVRAYLFRDGQALRLTSDHSWVQERINAGLLAPEHARLHPHRNVVTHALGAEATADPDVREVELQPQDTLLLCSDGLWGLAEDEELAGVVAGSGGAEPTANALMDLALARGGHDNITVIVVRAVAATTVPSTVKFARPPRE